MGESPIGIISLLRASVSKVDRTYMTDAENNNRAYNMKEKKYRIVKSEITRYSRIDDSWHTVYVRKMQRKFLYWWRTVITLEDTDPYYADKRIERIFREYIIKDGYDK